MPWFKVDDGLHSHPKAIEAGLEAMGLWVLMGSHCGFYIGQRGRISRASALRIAGSARVLTRCAERLIKAGLWVVDGDGWAFHEWETYQPTPEAVEAERQRKASAGRLGGMARARAAALREHQSSTTTTRNEHDDDTKRARVEHDDDTTTTSKTHADDAKIISTIENHSLGVKQLLESCLAGRDGTAVARPDPSRPVPILESERGLALLAEPPPRTRIKRVAAEPAVVGTTIPADWSVSDGLLAWAKKNGIAARDLESAAERFVDYWRQQDPSKNKKAIKIDWNAGFREWVRRDVDNGKIVARPTVAPVAVLPPQTPAQLEMRRTSSANVAAAIAEMTANVTARTSGGTP